MDFSTFINQVLAQPALLVTVLLTLGVILVNGWTDAPNAIATAVSTKALTPQAAIIMAAVFNFLGIVVMTAINKTVAETIYNMVDFGTASSEALIGLCAAMSAIVIWAIAAWWFGIPTSESHALIAGLTGAAIAMHNSLKGVNGHEWIKVIWGLVLSTFLGFLLGFLMARLITMMFRRVDRRKTTSGFRWAQAGAAAAMAFMHGAQDGQKFMGVFLLGIALSNGQGDGAVAELPFWLILLCSVVMGLGTSIGGRRIIKAVGMDMVKLQTYQGVAADLAGAVCLLLSSLTGIPVSTTHTKTTAIMGVGAAKRFKSVNWGIVRDMTAAWVITFPGCGLIGFVTAKIFLALF